MGGEDAEQDVDCQRHLLTVFRIIFVCNYWNSGALFNSWEIQANHWDVKEDIMDVDLYNPLQLKWEGITGIYYLRST